MESPTFLSDYTSKIKIELKHDDPSTFALMIQVIKLNSNTKSNIRLGTSRQICNQILATHKYQSCKLIKQLRIHSHRQFNQPI